MARRNKTSKADSGALGSLFDEEEIKSLEVIRPQQRVGTANTARNPYLTNNLFTSIINAIRMTTYKQIVIFLSDVMKPSETEAAIAVKDFMNENGFPCCILMDKRTAHIKNFYPDFESQFVYKLPCEDNEFIALAIGVDSRVDILCNQTYQKAVLTFSVSCGRESTSNFAAKHVNNPAFQCSTVLLYPMLKKLAADKNLVLSTNVKTKFLISMFFTLYGQRNICASTIDTFKMLNEDGADYNEAEYQINKISETTLECTKLLLNNMTVNDNLAVAMIKRSDMVNLQNATEKSIRHGFDKAVHMFRNLETAKAWIVYVEEPDGAFYVILQTRRNSGYDMRKVAKKNNGIGNSIMCRCIIYDMDIKKVRYDLLTYMKEYDEKIQAIASQNGGGNNFVPAGTKNAEA